ncbi:NAD(P)/FAD-dependent oxidoreductase [Paenibacillus methanolicus]|uniref:Thioredoxin reductase n=1 Tax=Paenibacillus methanolicus TaxID=582686 RepID=A0A5S5C063_9BACL|nr:NAD(P)/FAD-dependent oxidoreductase [Paenibacillus methanolicus]TYP71842.1 thioredoxin reductase [Paenibacillus methanolicus]
MTYDCIIVGGGLAGLQAAIQLGRYNRSTLVVDAGDGRSTLCRRYNNILGWSEGVSGRMLREAGKEQALAHGVRFLEGKAIGAETTAVGFVITTANGDRAAGRRLLLATGVVDRLPELPGLAACLGTSIYVCPDCDGYEATGQPSLILGAGDAGAHMALTVRYWTDKLTYVNHERAPVGPALRERMEEQGILYIEEPIARVEMDEGNDAAMTGITLQDGRRLRAATGFAAFGGNEVRAELAEQLGVQLFKNRHILVDARTKMTSVPGVWAAGDIVAHSEQTVIAMGDGSQAAIWMHKTLLHEELLERIPKPEPFVDLRA